LRTPCAPSCSRVIAGWESGKETIISLQTAGMRSDSFMPCSTNADVNVNIFVKLIVGGLLNLDAVPRDQPQMTPLPEITLVQPGRSSSAEKVRSCPPVSPLRRQLLSSVLSLASLPPSPHVHASIPAPKQRPRFPGCASSSGAPSRHAAKQSFAWSTRAVLQVKVVLILLLHLSE